MKKFLAVCTIILILAPTTFALAQTTPAPSNACTGDSVSLTRCVNQIYIWSMGAAALLALFMIVIGGYQTLTSAGNAARAAKGKEYIVSSLIGLVLLFGAYILLRTINPDLVDFSNNCINNVSSCGNNTSSTTQQPQH